MATNPWHLFDIEIGESKLAAGHTTWTIRDRGKLFWRSDAPYLSEEQARVIALVEHEQLQGNDSALRPTGT